MRRSSLLATAALAVTLLPSPSAYAAGETCQGRAATIVGSGAFVRGTEGPDVVVTNGVPAVLTLGGDDLVCVTGGSAGRFASVQTGDGDDVVDATAATGPTVAQLGAGSDTYTGSAQPENVEGGDDNDRAVYVDTEPDVIATGTGADQVLSGSDSEPDAPNADVVTVGSDAQVWWWGPMTADARLVGGGRSQLGVHLGAGAAVLDATAGTVTEDEVVTLRWVGFDAYDVDQGGLDAPASFGFVGSPRDEEVDLRVLGLNRFDIDLGDGDDALLVRSGSNVGASGSSYAGGAGRDRVALSAGRSLRLDLASGRMVSSYGGPRARARLTGFESSFVRAARLDLSGTRGDDDLRFQACRATVRGRAGDDRIAQSPYGRTFDGELGCPRRSFRLLGGAGGDVLRGSTGPDVLVGGAGRDSVAGGAGRDRCSGERLRSCEVRG